MNRTWKLEPCEGRFKGASRIWRCGVAFLIMGSSASRWELRLKTGTATEHRAFGPPILPLSDGEAQKWAFNLLGWV